MSFWICTQHSKYLGSQMLPVIPMFRLPFRNLLMLQSGIKILYQTVQYATFESHFIGCSATDWSGSPHQTLLYLAQLSWRTSNTFSNLANSQWWLTLPYIVHLLLWLVYKRFTFLLIRSLFLSCRHVKFCDSTLYGLYGTHECIKMVNNLLNEVQ